MDFESERKRKIITAVEVLIVIAFFLFVGYQIWLYISVRIAKSKQEREVIEEQLSHSVSADGDAALSAEAISTTTKASIRILLWSCLMASLLSL